MTSIAIVGAGSQMGLAIARTFGSQGFDVALISRNRDKLDDLVGKLGAEGVTAAAFPADVLDRAGLAQALKDAADRFGGIDVLEYSLVGTFGVTTLTAPATTEPSDVEFGMNFQSYGAIAATQAVLPTMRAAGAGSLLYTTGAGSIWPDPRVANVNAAAAALRNWVLNLHKELADAGTGIQAAHIGIDSSIGVSVIPASRRPGPSRSPLSTGTCAPPSGARPNSSSSSATRTFLAADIAPRPPGPGSTKGRVLMRALITTDYGDSPKIARIPRPGFGPDEVLVEVVSSSVNGFDAMAAGGSLKGVLPHPFRERWLTSRQTVIPAARAVVAAVRAASAADGPRAGVMPVRCRTRVPEASAGSTSARETAEPADPVR